MISVSNSLFCMNVLPYVQILFKMFRLCSDFSDNVQTFQTMFRMFRLFRQCSECSESVQIFSEFLAQKLVYSEFHDFEMYIIRCYHIPVLISKSASTRNTFVQTWRPGSLQNVEDGKSLCFLRQRCIISNFAWPQIEPSSGLASSPSSVSKRTCMMYHGIINYTWNLLEHNNVLKLM